MRNEQQYRGYGSSFHKIFVIKSKFRIKRNERASSNSFVEKNEAIYIYYNDEI